MIPSKIVGIDYSMSSPGVCIYGPTFQESQLHYLTDQAKLVGRFNGNIHGHFHKLFKSQEQRFEQIMHWALQCIGEFSNTIVYLEDYSMGSKGRVFHIAECAGLLKYNLYKFDIPFVTVPPTVLKKFAFGKGNAKKEDMYTAFLRDTNIDIKKLLTPNRKLGSPETDIVDSYFLARYGASLLAK
jgi:Holliday junction resolvasome RuvABC endonuclease subunit